MPFGPFSVAPLEGLVFGLVSLPLCLWAVYTDLSAMRIRNRAVAALVAVFVVIGPFLMPLDSYLWRFAHLAIVLAAGFALASLGAVGAGDAKFAAAMAPFVAAADIGRFLLLFAVLLVLTFAAHRVARATPAIRSRTPSWRSWTETKDFPMGVTLGTALSIYLLGAAMP